MGKNHVVQKDGVDYRVEEVRHEGVCVGLAPTLQFDGSPPSALQAMIDVFSDETVLRLALRQMREEAKNKVRSKFLKEKVSDSVVLKAIVNGEVDLKAVDKMAQTESISKRKAVVKMLGLGKESKPDAKKVHWDIL